MVKRDGCVAVHADGGAYKPLNWMNAPNRFVEEPGRWTVTNPKGERLLITIEEVLADIVKDLGVDPGLQKDGVEAHLQELLALACDAHRARADAWSGASIPTEIGPVDLLCRDGDGGAVAIEIKRRGEIDGVEQLTRYLDFLDAGPSLAPAARRLRCPGDQAAGQDARCVARDRRAWRSTTTTCAALPSPSCACSSDGSAATTGSASSGRQMSRCGCHGSGLFHSSSEPSTPRHVEARRAAPPPRARRVPLVLAAGVGVGVDLAAHDRHRLGAGRAHRHELGAEDLGGEDASPGAGGCG